MHFVTQVLLSPSQPGAGYLVSFSRKTIIRFPCRAVEAGGHPAPAASGNAALRNLANNVSIAPSGSVTALNRQRARTVARETGP